MRALSVRQPWASLIAGGKKTVELRSWATKYRGPLLILAGSSIWRGTEHPIGPRGVTLCVVDLIDVRASCPDDADAACIVPPPGFGFAWVLSGATPVRHVPAKGRLGLFAPGRELLEAIA